MNEPPTPRNIYSPRNRVVSPKGEEPAQQQFKEDCDINVIMKRFYKTNAIDHFTKHQPEYGLSSPLDYHQAMTLVVHADSMFNELPSELRNEFNNNPQAFLEFVQNPANADRAKELGIGLSTQAAAKAAELQDAAKPGEEVPSLQDASEEPVKEI